MRLVPLVLVAGLLAACATPPELEAGPDTAGPGEGGGAPELVVDVDPGDGSPAQRYTLVCGDPATGDHPDAAAACTHLAGLDDPFAPLPADAVCTEQYGGPQTARITGTWKGEPVDLELSRIDGCRISQWDSLGPLLPG